VRRKSWLENEFEMNFPPTTNLPPTHHHKRAVNPKGTERRDENQLKKKSWPQNYLTMVPPAKGKVDGYSGVN
jgi:hypothetical protein